MSVISAGTTLTTGLALTSDTNGNLIIKTGPSATTAVTLDSSGTATITNAIVTNLSTTSLTIAGSAFSKGAQDFIVQSYGIV